MKDYWLGCSRTIQTHRRFRPGPTEPKATYVELTREAESVSGVYGFGGAGGTDGVIELPFWDQIVCYVECRRLFIWVVPWETICKLQTITTRQNKLGSSVVRAWCFFSFSVLLGTSTPVLRRRPPPPGLCRFDVTTRGILPREPGPSGKDLPCAPAPMRREEVAGDRAMSAWKHGSSDGRHLEQPIVCVCVRARVNHYLCTLQVNGVGRFG